MSQRKPQAKDVPTEQIVALIRLLRRPMEPPYGPGYYWVHTFDLEPFLSYWYPWKVVVAKLNRLIERGVIDGCTCGCRGDFEVVADTPPLGIPQVGALSSYSSSV